MFQNAVNTYDVIASNCTITLDLPHCKYTIVLSGELALAGAMHPSQDRIRVK